MFDKEFYPTPISVLDLMKIDCKGKVVLEPSGGKGDIVEYLKSRGSERVISYEINKDLSKILQTKCEVIGDDFLKAKAEDISHVDLIVMNPPFSNANEHIVHAYNIAPEGCEIISLCNYNTIDNSRGRSKLHGLLNNYGISESLGSCFDTAERKTNVEIGLVKLFKPMVSGGCDFEGFYFEEDEDRPMGDGITSYDEVYAMVQRHVGAIKIFDKLDSAKKELEYTLSTIGIREINLSIGYDDKITSREAFSKSIQKRSWKHIFSKMKMEKYVTSNVLKDVNRFVEQQQKYPFTVKNIYRMFEIIVGTRQQTMNKSLEEAIDKFTRHTHKNRFGVEGWKTNSGHMLNNKFIVNDLVREKYWGNAMDLNYGQRRDSVNDLTKVICTIVGSNYDEIGSFEKRFSSEVLPGVWYSWGFFDFKAFKKGTVHFKFKNESDWYALNKAYGELKGFTLSDKYKK